MVNAFLDVVAQDVKAEFGIIGFTIQGSGYQAGAKRVHGNDRLKNTGSPQRVAGPRFGGADQRVVVELLGQRIGFDAVIGLAGGAVQIHVID